MCYVLQIKHSVLLDGYSAASITHGRQQHHTTVDASLTQLWRFLNQLSYAPTDCTFVYDGSERAHIKRGVQVITEEPLLYKKSKEMVRTFGFRVYMAKGDAEAELAIMNRKGVIDAVLTKDSDVFPLGAERVLKIAPSKLVVDIYDAKLIKDSLRLTTGGLILYSLLAGNDFDAGVQGFGPAKALAIAQCGFGNSLVEVMAGSPTQQQQYLEELRHKIIIELKNNSQGILQRCYPSVAQTLLDSDFPSRSALDWFLKPPNSWSDPMHLPDTVTWRPQGHNLPKIAQFCKNHIGWSATVALRKFHK
ncbi:PIN domain-like protein [Rhodocollybia butyracea]|uniref:PIN domain-like protein n=1 Tax=Rhodocollybia butyracea TaxID=206335 RepID=A0A9P5P9R7_9AGAR|nr:PIN domain-like protein [Rhodocollybia butyracea]